MTIRPWEAAPSDEWRPDNAVCSWGPGGSDSGFQGDSGSGYNAGDVSGGWDSYTGGADAYGGAYTGADAYGGGGYQGDSGGGYNASDFSGGGTVGDAYSGGGGYTGYDGGGGYYSGSDGGNFSSDYGANYGTDGGAFQAAMDSISASPFAGGGGTFGGNIYGDMQGQAVGPGFQAGATGSWGDPSGPSRGATGTWAGNAGDFFAGGRGATGNWGADEFADPLANTPATNLGPPTITGDDLPAGTLNNLLSNIDLSDNYQVAPKGDLGQPDYGPEIGGGNPYAGTQQAPGRDTGEPDFYTGNGQLFGPSWSIVAPALNATPMVNNLWDIDPVTGLMPVVDDLNSRFGDWPAAPAWSPGQQLQGGMYAPAQPFGANPLAGRDSFDSRFGGPYNDPAGPVSNDPFAEFGDAGGKGPGYVGPDMDHAFSQNFNPTDPGLDFSSRSSVNPNADLLDALPLDLMSPQQVIDARFGEWGNLAPRGPDWTAYDPAAQTVVAKDSRDNFNSRFGEWPAPEARDSFNSRFGEWQAPSRQAQAENQNMLPPWMQPERGELNMPLPVANPLNLAERGAMPLADPRGRSERGPQDIMMQQLAPARSAIERSAETGRAPISVTVAPSRSQSSQSPSRSSDFGRQSTQGRMDSLLNQARTAPTQAGRIAALDALNGLISATYGRGPYGSVGRGPYGGDPDPNIAPWRR